MSTFWVSICTDMDALRATGLVSEGSPLRGMIDGRSGAHVQYSPDRSMSVIVITSIEGLEGLELLPYITVTTYEEIFADEALTATYKAIYDYETPDDDGNYPSRYFAIPAGHEAQG